MNRFMLINKLLLQMLPADDEQKPIHKIIKSIELPQKEEIYVHFNEIISIYMKNTKDQKGNIINPLALVDNSNDYVSNIVNR